MNRAASITVSPSLLKCHHCCTRQTPLDYDQLKLSWTQFFLSPNQLWSYFRASGLLRKKKETHLFSSKKVQRAPNSWLSDGNILAWSLLQKTSICLWKSDENTFTQAALPFHQELKLLSISVQKRFAATQRAHYHAITKNYPIILINKR